MFNEILRIKPVLDPATTKQMEQNLSSRFARVAQRFGSGLKSVVKGSILGISLGLISKLLNPLEALEDKIKKLLGEGEDIRDLADRFGSSGGEIKQVQDVAQSLGVTPDQFKDLLTKYAQAIEKARDELSNPFAERSQSTLALKEFASEKDMVKSFLDFTSSLRAVGQGPGIPEALGHGEFRQRTGLETRQAFEKDVFGEAQHGAARRLIEANVPDIAKTIKEPSVDKLNQAVDKAAQLADQKQALDVQNQTADFVAATNKLNGKMIQDMAAADKLSLDRDTKQIDSYEDLKKASLAVDQVKGLMIDANVLINKGIGYLADMATFVGSLKNSRFFRGIFGGGD